ncbi:alpha-(1,3)-fucosyltransferase C-like [Ostrinia nubilalis]|uniref:alpha-(1,3)-fucosyltransferase C-like n=1 Tax=Ostrinia nubilalis TaxID=29057 RepID=UPI0030823831
MKPKKLINPKNMYKYHIKEMMFVSTFKKNLIRFCIYMALFLLAILISLLPYIISRRSQVNLKHVRYPTDLKYILFWNKPKHKKLLHKDYGFEFQTGQKLFIDQKCPHMNCYITYNRTMLNSQDNFDAIVFDVHEISKFKLSFYNFTRPPHQKYIFWSHESAEKQPICNPMFDDFFSWTWTYKLDSDIPHPFISIYNNKNQTVGPRKSLKWLQTMNHTDAIRTKVVNKNKAIAWVVTKCKLKNMHKDFIKDLRNEMKGYNYSLDVFGPCGDKRCPGGVLNKCYKMVEKKYFFQLVLEDTFAADYVSDKLVKALEYFTVPIVLGGANYTRFLPPGTYINAQAFDMKKLGALIDYLIKNPIMYEYFFDWKNHYYYTVNPTSNVCNLCKKLNKHTEVVKNKENFRQWWNPDYADVCQRMHLLDIFTSY